MKPSLDFTVVEWASAEYVLKVRLAGRDHLGSAINRLIVFDEPVHIGDVHTMIAKMNNGSYRSH